MAFKINGWLTKRLQKYTVRLKNQTQEKSLRKNRRKKRGEKCRKSFTGIKNSLF